MIKKAYLYIFSILALVFGIVGLAISFASLAPASVSFNDVILWAQDSVLHYNTNYNATANIIFFFVLFLIAALSFVVMIPVLLMKKNYLLIPFLIAYFVSFIFGLIPVLNFLYLDFNFGLNGIGIIDIDIFAMIIGIFGLCFSIGALAMIIINIKKTTFKYDPVVIHGYKN